MLIVLNLVLLLFTPANFGTYANLLGGLCLIVTGFGNAHVLGRQQQAGDSGASEKST